MSLPLSDVLAGHLATLTGWKVSFRPILPGDAKSALGQVQTLADGSREVRFQVRNGLANSAEVSFVQPPEPWSTTLLRPGILAALAAFLVLALAVGYWLARSLIRPLQSFSQEASAAANASFWLSFRPSSLEMDAMSAPPPPLVLAWPAQPCA